MDSRIKNSLYLRELAFSNTLDLSYLVVSETVNLRGGCLYIIL